MIGLKEVERVKKYVSNKMNENGCVDAEQLGLVYCVVGILDGKRKIKIGDYYSLVGYTSIIPSIEDTEVYLIKDLMEDKIKNIGSVECFKAQEAKTIGTIYFENTEEEDKKREKKENEE